MLESKSKMADDHGQRTNGQKSVKVKLNYTYLPLILRSLNEQLKSSKSSSGSAITTEPQI